MEEKSVNSEQLAANRFLYKGLHTDAFPIYFRQGGISPKHPNYPWITQSLKKAVENAGFFSDMGSQFTLAVIDRNRVDSKGTLVRFENAGDEYKEDYYGNEIITWDDTSKIFTTKRGLDQIREGYEETHPEMSWEEFSKKIEVVESGEDFNEKIQELWENSLTA